MDVKTMRAQTVSLLADITQATGMRFSRLNFSVDSCDDQGGAPYHSASFGFFTKAPTLADSQRRVGGWTATLIKKGWATDTSAVTHRGTILTKDGVQLFLYPVDPHDPAPVASLELFGACHDLPNAEASNLTNLRVPIDILHEIQPK